MVNLSFMMMCWFEDFIVHQTYLLEDLKWLLSLGQLFVGGCGEHDQYFFSCLESPHLHCLLLPQLLLPLYLSQVLIGELLHPL